nr:RNA-directed DNA polymerase, eukaryota [Tanacetum cinerariifolium]
MVDGDWIDDPDLVKQEFRSHFANIFQDPGSGRGSLNFLFPNRLSNDQILDLESSISKDEIRIAVWGCGVDKSPGPDGFTFEFFRKYWAVVGPDFSTAVECLFSGKASILVYGRPTPEFHFHRGLKQGDPLAPFLFLLIMESLHLSFSRAVEAGIFIGMLITIQKSHLLGVGIPDNCVAEDLEW